MFAEVIKYVFRWPCWTQLLLVQLNIAFSSASIRFV